MDLHLDNLFSLLATYKSNDKEYIAMATMKPLQDGLKAPIVLLTQFHGEKPLFEENENVKINKGDNAKYLNSKLIEIFRNVN